MQRRYAIVAFTVAVLLIAGSVTYVSLARTTTPVNHVSSGPIKVTDSLNRSFTFNSTVTRIVSVDPSATVTLYALGAYKDIVGGNSLDSYPPNSTLPNVGNSFGLNTEEIYNLSPQVVLFYGATMSRDANYTNNTLHIPVLVDNPSSFSQIENFTHMLGVLTGTERNASLITSWMNSSFQVLHNATENITQQKSVFYYLSNYGGYWTAGNDTFIGQIFSFLHLKNIATGSGYYPMSGEDIVNDSPQIIFLDQYVNYSAVTQQPFSSTPAFANNSIYAVFNDNFFDQPDFRIIYAVYWVLTVVYPSSFVNLPAFPIDLQYPPTTGF